MDEATRSQLPGGENSDYPARVSEVGEICVLSIASSSILQLGDRADVDASLRALAVQRETDHSLSGDVYFEAYQIFSRPIPPLSPFLAEAAQADPLVMSTENCEPRISVGRIEIIAASSSALLLVGNGVNTQCQSRISNIRQFARPYAAPAFPANVLP